MFEQKKVLLVLTVVLAAVLLYAFAPSEGEGSWIKKIGLNALKEEAVTEEDSVWQPVAPVLTVDSTSQRILLLGESMVEGLSRPFADYCAANGHEYNSVCWYSSTTEHWAKTDTLKYFLDKYDPTYVMVTIGGNEMFVKDLDDRKAYIRKILSVIGDRKMVWIGTPFWKQDSGINELTRRLVGEGRFFDSSHLQIPRKKDGAHPTTEASLQWMDSVAQWISSFDNKNPIIFNKYTEHAKEKHLVLLQPSEI